MALSERRGFVGGGDLSGHVRHACAFASVFESAPERVLDLGSGGGLPGLVLAFIWSDAEILLLDGSSQRAAFLQESVDELELGDRVRVLRGRAEELARDEAWRSTCDIVVVRSFGPPAVVAECGAGFLRVGGSLAVSEPPDGAGSRWSHPTELAAVGLKAANLVRADGFGFQVLEQSTLCPERYPRRVGIPTKRPLF